MGLFVDLDPEEMLLGVEGNLDDPDLEAELAALTGDKAAAGGRPKQKGRSECYCYDIRNLCKLLSIICHCWTDDCMKLEANKER